MWSWILSHSLTLRNVFVGGPALEKVDSGRVQKIFTNHPSILSVMHVAVKKKGGSLMGFDSKLRRTF